MRGTSLFLVCAVVGGASFSARAGRGECRSDVAKFCKGTPIGDGRVVDCLKSHEAEVSAGCKTSLAAREHKREEVKAEWKAAHELCKSDVQNVCKGVERGQGRIHKCLKEHEAQLSAGCKGEITKIKEIRQSE